MRSTALSILLSLFILNPIKAEEIKCKGENYRAFDFWLGNWQVTTSADNAIRHNKISSINNGCTLLEEYSTPSGYLGKSLNIYNKQTQKWHQTWTDNSGLLLKLDGGLVGESMVMKGITKGSSGIAILNKITWTPSKNGTVRQFWQTSVNNGKTWQVVFDGLYTKTPAN